MVSSILTTVNDAKANMGITAGTDRKSTYRPLILNAEGKEVDEHGNLVKHGPIVKTLAANAAIDMAAKKKENPYLLHKQLGVNNVGGRSGVSADVSVDLSVPAASSVGEDPRLHVVDRSLRGRKGLKFAEAGSLVREADKLRLKEERKLIAGYASGRKALEVSFLC
jgi:hypothetical protein